MPPQQEFEFGNHDECRETIYIKVMLKNYNVNLYRHKCITPFSLILNT